MIDIQVINKYFEKKVIWFFNYLRYVSTILLIFSMKIYL